MKIFFKGLIIFVTIAILLVVIFLVKFGKYTPNEVQSNFKNSNFLKNYYSSEKLLFVNVWATHCKPCIAEFPELEKIESDNNFNFISISTDTDSLRLKKFLLKNPIVAQRDITMKNFNARKEIFSKIELPGAQKSNSIISVGATVIPYSVLIKNKKIIAKYGFDTKEINFVDLKKLIDQNK